MITNGIPNKLNSSIFMIEALNCSQTLALSPVQWTVYLPEVIEVALDRVNPLLPVASSNPLKIIVNYNVILVKLKIFANFIML